MGWKQTAIFNDHLEIFFIQSFILYFLLSTSYFFQKNKISFFPFQFGSTMRYKHKGFDSNFFVTSYRFVLFLFFMCYNYHNTEKQLLLLPEKGSRERTWGQNYKRQKIIHCHLFSPIVNYLGVLLVTHSEKQAIFGKSKEEEDRTCPACESSR